MTTRASQSEPLFGQRWIATFSEVFGIDLRTMALFRVLLGCFIILDLALRSRDLSAHYTDFGVMPRDVAIDYLSVTSFSIHLLNGTAAFQLLLFAIAAWFACLLILGWRTRLVSIVSWALLLSLQNRNTEILSGEDHLLMVLVFWAMFLPMGARYSIDAALDRSKDQVSNQYFSLATLALLVQGMSMYFFSALQKTDDRWWPDGTAVYYTLQLDYFVTPVGLWLRQFEPLLEVLTHYIYWLEMLGPILMFTPLLFPQVRALVMAAFISMHIGFMMCLEIGIFPLISIVMNLAFLPGRGWDVLQNKLHSSKRDKLFIYYDQDCNFCLKTCRLLRIFLFLGPVAIRPAQPQAEIWTLMQQHNSWVVHDGTDTHLGWDAMIQLFQHSPIFWPLAKLLAVLPFRQLGNQIYRLVSLHREWLSQFTNAAMPWRVIKLREALATSAIVLFFLILVTVQNLSTLPALDFKPAKPFTNVRQLFGLYQNWNMFAPYPETISPWPVISGRLVDDTLVDVYNQIETPPDTTKPALVSAVYHNYRWRKYLSNLEDQSYESVPKRIALNYGRYLCRLWNDDRTGDRRLAEFEVVFYVESTPEPSVQKVVGRRPVWRHRCI